MEYRKIEYGKQTLVAYGDTVQIYVENLFGGQREKTILIRNITSVEVKKPGLFFGFIQFSIAGGQSRNSAFSVTGGASSAIRDENSMIFRGESSYKMALQIKSYIASWTQKANLDLTTQVVSAADELRGFKELMDDGIITKDEYEQKKCQLLKLNS